MTTGQKLALVAVVLVTAVFVGAFFLPGRVGQGNAADNDSDGLLAALAALFEGSADAEPDELRADCPLNPTLQLLIQGTCTLTVAPAEQRLRILRLTTTQPGVVVSTRIPEKTSTTATELEPDEETAVAVDMEGADIVLRCPGLNTSCSVQVVHV